MQSSDLSTSADHALHSPDGALESAILEHLDWNKLTTCGLTRDNFSVDSAGGVVQMTRILSGERRVLPMVLPKHAFLLAERSLRMLHGLQVAGAQFSLDAAGRLLMEAEGVRCFVDGAEELYIVHEIFAQRIYRLKGRSPVVVWDIGMNVGLASLFLASQPEVIAVYGFEPFVPTFEQAGANFALNPEVAPKIQAFNHGLGAVERTMSAAYDYQNKGSSGTHSQVARVTSAQRSETVVIKSAVDALDRIIAVHPGTDVVAKIDCEGAEYEIFDALAVSGRLGGLSALMVEWHERGAEELVAHLTRAGFTTFAPNDPVPEPGADVTGMLYAVRAG